MCVILTFDCDGILSAAIAQKVWGGRVVFQKWHKFAVDAEDVALIRSLKPKVVAVTDLGAEEESLGLLSGLAAEGVKVWVFDNHPPEDLSTVASYAGENFHIVTSSANCSAGLLYDAVKDALEDYGEWAKTWAALAIYGDVMTDAEQGKPMYDAILAENPVLSSKILRWGKGEDGKFATQESDMVARLSGYFNTPRRIARHYGAYTALQMAREIEKAGDVTLPEQGFGRREEALYPATFMVKKWRQEWYDRWTDVFKAENMRFWDLGDFTFSVVSHEWNVGTQVANIKAGDKERSKPHLCLNLCPFDGYVTIGARKPKEGSSLHLGKVLNRAGELSGGVLKGGGLSMAASAHAPAGITVSEVVNLLVRAVKEVV